MDDTSRQVKCAVRYNHFKKGMYLLCATGIYILVQFTKGRNAHDDVHQLEKYAM